MADPHSASKPISELIHRIQGEFLEMPGLRLTGAQARRLWGLDPSTCSGVLAALVDADFLTRTRDGAYVRRGAGDLRRTDPTAA